MDSKIFLIVVTPAGAGVQNVLKQMDGGFRRNGEIPLISDRYESVKIGGSYEKGRYHGIGEPRTTVNDTRKPNISALAIRC
jgi:hypothetical protein